MNKSCSHIEYILGRYGCSSKADSQSRIGYYSKKSLKDIKMKDIKERDRLRRGLINLQDLLKEE